MVVSFPMYERKETHLAILHFWNLIQKNLKKNGFLAPYELKLGVDETSIWMDPNLVLSDTCGMPFRNFLHKKVKIVGTLDYGLDNCPPGYYRSCLVIRKSDTRKRLANFQEAVFSYNQNYSQSGFAAPLNYMKSLGLKFVNMRVSGSHLNSAIMVVNGDADITSLDGISWRLMQRYNKFTEKLKILCWTEPATPSLPLITSLKNETNVIFDAVCEAIKELDTKNKDILSFHSIVNIPEKDYLAVKNP